MMDVFKKNTVLGLLLTRSGDNYYQSKPHDERLSTQ